MPKVIRNQTDINSMQPGFMPGLSTTDAIFLVRELQGVVLLMLSFSYVNYRA